jgi:uncharacterized ubiquitin-like protein YukD
MKVLVNINGAQEASEHRLTVSPSDTVGAVKMRLELLEPVAALQGARLIYEGKDLDDNARLSDCGVGEGSSLGLAVAVSAEALAQQLSELLQARGLPIEELGLLYSHRHGATVGDVLRFLGKDAKLSHFLEEKKQFVVEGGRARLQPLVQKPAGVKLVQLLEEEDVPGAEGAKVSVVVKLCTPSAGEVKTKVEVSVGKADTVSTLKERVAEIEMLPFSNIEVIANGSPLNDDQWLSDCTLSNGNSPEVVVRVSEDGLAAQLAGLLVDGGAGRCSSPDELGLRFCYKYGAPVGRALKLLGKTQSIASFLKDRKEFAVQNGCVMLASSKANRSLDDILEAASFLNVGKVDRAVEGSAARATVHLAGLPAGVPEERWLPGLLRSVAAGLGEKLGSQTGGVKVADNSVQVTCDGGAVHELRFVSMAQ